MWNLTKEAGERFSNSHLLSVYEYSDNECDEEEQIYLDWQITKFKDKLLQVLPARFHPYIEDGSLNKPTLSKDVREDYLAWVMDEEQCFTQILDAANRCSQETLTLCPEAVQDAFSQSLHDAQIWHIERVDGNVIITLKCDCFTSKEVIVLIFEKVLSETSKGQFHIGQHYIYDELRQTKNGFALRLLCENNTEWTIEATSLDARSYYYPVAQGHLYNEGILQNTSIEQYIKKLNLHDCYTFIALGMEIPITNLRDQAPYIELAEGEIQVKEDGVFAVVNNHNCRLGDNGEALISYIYTNVYEDPFAIQRTPLPEDELEVAIFGDNAILQVRAWHTLQGNPQHFSTIINTIFRKFEHTEDTHMMLYVYVNAFFKAAVLHEDIVEKYKELIEPLG